MSRTITAGLMYYVTDETTTSRPRETVIVGTTSYTSKT